MKHYELIKCETFTSLNGKQYNAPVANYGIMCEEDVKLTTRGYKAEIFVGDKIIYTRKNSKYCFEAYER